MHHIVQSQNVLVIELLHQGDLTDRSGRRPFLGIQVNLFQGHQLISLVIPTFIDLILSWTDVPAERPKLFPVIKLMGDTNRCIRAFTQLGPKLAGSTLHDPFLRYSLQSHGHHIMTWIHSGKSKKIRTFSSCWKEFGLCDMMPVVSLSGNERKETKSRQVINGETDIWDEEW